MQPDFNKPQSKHSISPKRVFWTIFCPSYFMFWLKQNETLPLILISLRTGLNKNNGKNTGADVINDGRKGTVVVGFTAI